jgi:copper chaperone
MEMKNAVVKVPEVHCDHCKSSLEGAVGKAPGVNEVKVDLDDKTITLKYSPGIVDSATITSIIEEQGYEVTEFAEV